MFRWLIIVVLLQLSSVLSAEAQRLYAIAFADTDDAAIGVSMKKDLQSFRTLAAETAIYLNCDISLVSYTGARNSPQYFKHVMDSISFNEDDIVLFAYLGHGLRAADDVSEFPQITFNSSNEAEYIPLENVKTMLVNKGARFVLVIGGCSNVIAKHVSPKPLLQLKKKKQKSRNSSIKKTFFTEQGMLLFQQQARANLLGLIKMEAISVKLS